MNLKVSNLGGMCSLGRLGVPRSVPSIIVEGEGATMPPARTRPPTKTRGLQRQKRDDTHRIRRTQHRHPENRFSTSPCRVPVGNGR